MSRGLIVFDSDHPLARQNRCFDAENEYLGPGYSFFVRLAHEAHKRDLEIITADVFLENKKQTLEKTVCITDMVTQFTDRLIKSGVQPAICISLESPLIARKFYHRISKFAGRFRHNFQFRGTMQRLVASETVFHPIVFPTESRIPQRIKAWENRNFLIMVNSNKRAAFNNWDDLGSMIHSAISQMHFSVLKIIDPWMRIRELYVDRIKAIHYFSANQNFKLYGYGWEKPIPGFGRKYHNAAIKSYNGVISSDVRIKREVMSGFKFAICFENCIFPGYITEKIFDCFLSGCIPVYLGAPDITDFVPSEAFIDYRLFENYSDLDKFMREMTMSEANRYLNAASKFIEGSAFDKFLLDYLVNDILNAIEQEFDK